MIDQSMKPGIIVGTGLIGLHNKLGYATFLACLALPLFFLMAIKTNQRLSIVDLEVSMSSMNAAINEEVRVLDGATLSTSSSSNNGSAAADAQPGMIPSSGGHSSHIAVHVKGGKDTGVASKTSEIVPENVGPQPNLTVLGASSGAKERSMVDCDFSGIRTDVCELRGDVRIHGPSSTVKLIETPLQAKAPACHNSSASTTWKIRPYARKWEASTMASIKELTLSISSSAIEHSGGHGSNSLLCGLNQSVPAIVFSTGGFQQNFFHEMVDVVTPLFLTSHHYGGEVQFLIVDFKPLWVEKYRVVIQGLSRYEVINLDEDERVHCFRDVVVGLWSHRELGIDPLTVPEGSSVLDFRQFLRRVFDLKRDFLLTPPKQVKAIKDKNHPRLLIVSRRKTRVLLNERQVANLAWDLGYNVVIATPEQTRNLTEMARIVNSCDVMMGVHGAGLSNMLFLPTNATIIQIIPWGNLRIACEFAFGEPAIAMGLKYLHYEIGKNESSLIKQYPENHPVLINPLSIHKQGFGAIWTTYLNNQDVTLDLDRFEGVLQQAMELIQ